MACEHVAQRGLVGGVAGQHLVGQRQPLGRDHQRHHDLDTVAAFVAAVTEAARVILVGRHGGFEVGAGQVIEEHLEAGVEQVAPALAQMPEELLLVRQQQVEAAIERVILRRPFADPEQIGQRCRREPMPMQPPFAARREQPVDREDAQDLLPIRALAAQRQPRAEEVVQVQRAPEFVGQPARAPLAGTLQPQPPEVDLHRVGPLRREAIGRKERELARLPKVLVEDPDAALPRLPLAVVDLPKVEHVPVRHLPIAEPTALHHRPRAVLFAVLLADTTLQEHARSLSVRHRRG